MNKFNPYSAACRFGAAFLFALGVALVPVSAATSAPLPKITITTQPTAKVEISATNQSPTISVSASLSPSGTLAYQWYNGKNAIAGASQSTLTVTSAGSYTCKISGGTAKVVTSKASVVTISFAPVVLPQGMAISASGSFTEKDFNTKDGAHPYTGTNQAEIVVTDAVAKTFSNSYANDKGESGSDTATYTYKRVSSNKGIITSVESDSTKNTLIITFTGFYNGTFTLVYKGSYSDGSYKETWDGNGSGTFTVVYP
jgi:hypothetical protein